MNIDFIELFLEYLSTKFKIINQLFLKLLFYISVAISGFTILKIDFLMESKLNEKKIKFYRFLLKYFKS